MMRLSCILNTLWKSLVRVSSSLPNLLSQAMPTQSFPTIPTRVPPLYSWIDIRFLKIFQITFISHPKPNILSGLSCVYNLLYIMFQRFKSLSLTAKVAICSGVVGFGAGVYRSRFWNPSTQQSSLEMPATLEDQTPKLQTQQKIEDGAKIQQQSPAKIESETVVEKSQSEVVQTVSKQQSSPNEEKISETKEPQTEQAIEKPAEEVKEEQKLAQKPKKQFKKIISPTPYRNFSDIPELNLEQIQAMSFGDNDYAVIVADFMYSTAFQEEVMGRLRQLFEGRSHKKDLQIYRTKTEDPNIRKLLCDEFKANIKNETIFLLRNPYEKNLINIDFEIYSRFPNILSIYLTDLNIIKSEAELSKHLAKMSPNETSLLQIIDPNSQGYHRAILEAKYVQLNLGMHRMDNIKLVLADGEAAKSVGLLDSPKTSTLHLVRKSNDFTYKPPNRWLLEGKPFHLLENVKFFDKQGEPLIQRYLSKIETFNSMQIDAPYTCWITIDRNRISPKEERQILSVFGKLKRQKIFPQVSFVLAFSEVEYRGHEEEPYGNRKWILKMANVEANEKEVYVHQMKTKDQINKLGISEEEWQRKTYQYLYREPEIKQQCLKEFIQRVLEGEEPHFYKTQKKIKLQKLNKITGENYQEEIFADHEHSHWLFEHSDHCVSCQMLSPLMENYAEISSQFPTLKTKVHGMNCDLNRLKNQPYSPYTPNLYYFSRNWGNRWPIRYPIMEFINQLGLKGLYDFSEISESLSKIDLEAFEKHIRSTASGSTILKDLQNL